MSLGGFELRLGSDLHHDVTCYGICIDDFCFVRDGKVIRSRTFCYEGNTYVEEKHDKRVLSFRKKDEVWR